MTTTERSTTAHGPIDYLLIEFPGDEPTGAAADALADLVAAGIVRIYDLVVIRKDNDGGVSGVELTDVSQTGLGGFTAFAGAQSGLLGDEDISEAAEAMNPGTTSVCIVYENSWAVPFVAAAMDAGAELVASARIPGPVITSVLEGLESEN